MSEVIFRGGTILTVDDDERVLHGDVACRDGAIVQVGGEYTPQTGDFDIVECAGSIVMRIRSAGPTGAPRWRACRWTRR